MEDFKTFDAQCKSCKKLFSTNLYGKTCPHCGYHHLDYYECERQDLYNVNPNE